MRIALLITWAVACGGNGGTSIDATPGDDADAATDALVPAGPAKVRVLDAGVPAVGVTVVFHTADGSVLSETTTGANGEASITDPPPGTMVTVVHVGLYTVIGIEPGDTILVGTTGPTVEPATQVRAHYPSSFPSATLYLTDLGCAGFAVADPALVVTTDVGVSCLGSDNDFDALAIARLGTTPLAYSALRDVAPAATGPTDLTIPAWTAAETRTFAMSNLAAEITQSAVDVRFVMGEFSKSNAPRTGTTLTVPSSSLVDGWNTYARATAIGATESRIWLHRQVLAAATPDPVTIDFTTMGPRFDTVTLATTTPARPVISWTTSASIATDDAVAVGLSWNDTTLHTWTIVAPSTATSVTAPVLPASLAALQPSATATYSLLTAEALWFASDAGYRGYRNDRPFAFGSRVIAAELDEARWQFFQTSAP